MPVRVGNSYVSEAAYSYAQSKLAEEGKGGEVLKDLSGRFRDVKFSVGTQPFAGTGTNNISIAPNILRQMEKDPEKRLEYEALIYDCNECLKNEASRRDGLKSCGFIIGQDGGLRMWSISVSDNGQQRNHSKLDKKDKQNWLATLLPQKKDSGKGNKAAAVRRNMAAQAGAKTAQNTGAKKQAFASTKELLSHLRDQYSVIKDGHASISGKYLRDCLKDEDKLQSLYEKLAAADMALEEAKERGGFMYMNVKIDKDGEVTIESGSRKIGFNGTKRARQIAAANSSSDINTVMNLLQIDLAQCQDGLRDGACDEAEVEKVKVMIERAQKRRAELAGKDEEAQGADAFSIDLLI